MIITNEPLYILAVLIRVLFLVLFTGAYLWFTVALSSTFNLLPPPQRLELVRGMETRFLTITWIFIAVMTVGGFATLFFTNIQLNLSTIVSTQAGIILAFESVVTLLIVICNALIQFVFLPKAKQVSISTSQSSDGSLKWLTAKDSSGALKAISNISMLSIANIALGIIAIALGVIFSNL